MIDIGGRDCCVRLSGGAGSAITAVRCVEWYGKDRVTLLFADTNTESIGNYELVKAVQDATGVPVTRLNPTKMDIWDVFDEHGVMRMVHAGGACKASVELKQKPLDSYMKSRWHPEDVVIATGMTYEERFDRQVRLQKKLDPWKCIFPLNEKPILGQCDIVSEMDRLGLPVSDAYRLGLPHDNCNGGCVLAGMKQWAALLHDNPSHFEYCENREWAFFEKTGFSILRDRRGGETKSYPLRQLRVDIENGRSIPVDSWRSTCGCMILDDGTEELEELKNG